MTSDDMENRLEKLRAEWPVGSVVDNVMARIAAAAPRRTRWRARLFAGLAASGLAAALGLAWLIIASQPTTLLATVQNGLKRARSAHLVITSWNDGAAPQRAEIWYRKGEGLRAEAPGQVVVENGKVQWSWQTGQGGGELVVLRQPSPGFFTTMLPRMLALPEIPGDWARVRSHELDRELDGRACQGFTLTPPDVNSDQPKGTQFVNQPAFRGLVLADADGRIHEITVQQRRDDGTWRRVREIRIEYEVPVSAELVAARLPARVRVVDRDKAFSGLYPLDRALHQVELGGLILAVHDLQPLKDRDGEGFYVVSSVRGTPEFLKEYPPSRQLVNPESVSLDVARQLGSNGSEGNKYIRIVLGSAAREGVEFSWWLVVRRRFFQVKNGQRVDLPDDGRWVAPGEPGRLDELPGKAWVPLSATYADEKHRDPKGVQTGVSTWAEVALPTDRPPTTLDDVAGRARRELLLMGVGGSGRLFGVAAGTERDDRTLRVLSRFSPETVSDADFAAAVRRGLDDMRLHDEIRDPGPEDRLPPAGGGNLKR